MLLGEFGQEFLLLKVVGLQHNISLVEDMVHELMAEIQQMDLNRHLDTMQD